MAWYFDCLTMADALQKLFGSAARVKLLRLFLFNPRQSFTVADAAVRARVTENEVKRETNLFLKAEVIQHARRGKGTRLTLNPTFAYSAALQSLLLNAPTRGEDMITRLKGLGVVRLIILSGMFVGEWEGDIDLLVVGDKIVERKLRERIRMLESEIGKEVRYTLLTSEQFTYRMNMQDKLLRDVLDYPHKIVLDRLHIGLK